MSETFSADVEQQAVVLRIKVLSQQPISQLF